MLGLSLLADGAPVIVLGTPGGSTIFTSVFQVLLNLVDAGLAPQDAVDATPYLALRGAPRQAPPSRRPRPRPRPATVPPQPRATAPARRQTVNRKVTISV